AVVIDRQLVSFRQLKVILWATITPYDYVLNLSLLRRIQPVESQCSFLSGQMLRNFINLECVTHPTAWRIEEKKTFVIADGFPAESNLFANLFLSQIRLFAS